MDTAPSQENFWANKNKVIYQYIVSSTFTYRTSQKQKNNVLFSHIEWILHIHSQKLLPFYTKSICELIDVHIHADSFHCMKKTLLANSIDHFW